jgi:hypothetical protein
MDRGARALTKVQAARGSDAFVSAPGRAYNAQTSERMMNARKKALRSPTSRGAAIALALSVGGGLAFADAAPFTVSAPTVSAKANVPAQATVSIKPGPGYHFNVDYPTSLKLTANPDVDAPARVDKASGGVKIEASGASFDVKLVAKTPGAKNVEGTLSFAVCTATTCDPRKVPVTLHIDAK